PRRRFDNWRAWHTSLVIIGVVRWPEPACDCVGSPCGGAAAPPPPRQGVGEQCPQGTMLAGRPNDGHCAAKTLGHGGPPRGPRGARDQPNRSRRCLLIV